MRASCEPWKWLFLVLYLIIAGLSNWAVLAYTHDFVPRDPLPDVFFSLFPEQEWASRCGDYMVTTCLLCLILLLIFHESRTIVMRRVIFIAATLYAMRSLTLFVTQLPPGYEDNAARCRERIKSFWLPNLAAVVGVVCMIISRTHYTIDIVIAYWLSSFVFRSLNMLLIFHVIWYPLELYSYRIYHAYCEVDIYMERCHSVLHGLWLCRLVAWLEENIVPGKIENKWNIPFADFCRSVFVNRAPGHHKQISIVGFGLKLEQMSSSIVEHCPMLVLVNEMKPKAQQDICSQNYREA
uniref:PAP2_C domain-containing protein n=1 Tax=Heterorhabditis bacteriophora TaxID=37862 RepID=A0A1I7XTG2_HETBA